MNKPIAWIDKNTGKPRMEGFIQTDHDIPLYTHPVELTDEEILYMSDSFCIDDEVSTLYSFTASGLLNFIKAILRKAQER